MCFSFLDDTNGCLRQNTQFSEQFNIINDFILEIKSNISQIDQKIMMITIIIIMSPTY